MRKIPEGWRLDYSQDKDSPEEVKLILTDGEKEFSDSVESVRLEWSGGLYGGHRSIDLNDEEYTEQVDTVINRLISLALEYEKHEAIVRERIAEVEYTGDFLGV